MEPKVTQTAALKTYSRSKCWKVTNPKDIKSEPLSTKEAVKYLLQGSLKRRVCRFCLSATTSLSELDEILDVGSSGPIFQVTIRDMVASFYPFQVLDDPNFPNKICGKCLDRTINCYLFTQQCERAERAIRNCFVDISEKFDKLDPLEPVKRRGRQKLNPNHNIIHVEHKNVIDYAEPVINIVNCGSSLLNSNTEVKINELECPRCWQVFTNVQSLVNHEKIHPKSMWYNCKFCGNSFVKHSHYKKHIKQFHGKENNKIDKQQFQCNECDTVCEEFDIYLQHIEKHKFKNVLEHLLEKKMDNLCGVCLDKGDRMTNLNETLSMHGGYPELSGEMTVATVLTTTIPEKSHKYDEFLVCKNANRVAIIKRKTKTAVKNKQAVKKTITKTSDKAMKLTTVTHETFQFSKPIKVFNNLIKDVDETDSLLDKTKSVDNLSPNNSIPGKFIGRVGFPFSFSSPINILDDSSEIKDWEQQLSIIQSNIVKQSDGIENTSDITKTSNLCITCSILKKAQCQKCIEKTSTGYGAKNTNVENESMETETCKMCWIFGKVGKCNYCKEHNDDKTVQNKDISEPQEPEKVNMTPKVNVEPATVIEIPKKNIEEENIPKQQNLELEKVIPIPTVNVESDKDISTLKKTHDPKEVVSNQKFIELEKAASTQERKIELEEMIPKRNITLNIEPKGIITTKKRRIEPEEGISKQKANTELEEVIPSRKRKIDPETESPIVKRSKWQCEICLTNNDRERCICCGEKKIKDNSTNFSFAFTKCNYTPKRNKNKQDAVKNNNYIAANNNEEDEKTEEVTTVEKKEENQIEVTKNVLIPNISLGLNTEANVIKQVTLANVIKEDTNQIKLHEEQMDVNFDDSNIGKVVGNVAKFDGNVVKFDENVPKFDGNVPKFDGNVVKFDANVVKFDGNVAKFDGNVAKFDGNATKLDGNVPKFDNIIGNFGKIDSNIGKAPVMPNMNFNFGSTSFTPMQSFTPPVMQNFSPVSGMTPPQFSSLSFNIGSQDTNKSRKILKGMRHRRERQVKK